MRPGQARGGCGAAPGTAGPAGLEQVEGDNCAEGRAPRHPLCLFGPKRTATPCNMLLCHSSLASGEELSGVSDVAMQPLWNSAPSVHLRQDATGVVIPTNRWSLY